MCLLYLEFATSGKKKLMLLQCCFNSLLTEMHFNLAKHAFFFFKAVRQAKGGLEGLSCSSGLESDK